MGRFSKLDIAAGGLACLVLFLPLLGGGIHSASSTSDSTIRTSLTNPLFWLFALTLLLVLAAAAWSRASVSRSKHPLSDARGGIGGRNDPMA